MARWLIFSALPLTFLYMTQVASIMGRRKAFVPLVFLVPLALSACLYLSAVFVFVSAVPLVFAQLRYGRLFGLVCAISNLAIVGLTSGSVNAALFFVVAVVLSAGLAECIRLTLKIEWTIVACSLLMALTSSVLVVSYSRSHHLHPIEEVGTYVGSVIDRVAQDIEVYRASGKVTNQEVERFLADTQATKRNVMLELPSFFAIGFILLTVFNFLILLRLNLLNIREKLGLGTSFFKNWKSPEILVWPTIAAAFCLIVEIPVASAVALNVFKVLMSIYALHGLAILCFLFDEWGVRGFLRSLGYVIAVIVLLPLVISLGFFDLWFAFRVKLKK